MQMMDSILQAEAKLEALKKETEEQENQKYAETLEAAELEKIQLETESKEFISDLYKKNQEEIAKQKEAITTEYINIKENLKSTAAKHMPEAVDEIVRRFKS